MQTRATYERGALEQIALKRNVESERANFMTEWQNNRVSCNFADAENSKRGTGALSLRVRFDNKR